LTFIPGVSNLYQILSEGSLYEQEVCAVFGTFPTGHTIAATREMHTKSKTTRKSMGDNKPTFMYTWRKYFMLLM